MLGYLDKWFNHDTYFRYVFFIFLALSILMTTLFYNENFFILYNLSVIFLGIGFYKKPVYLVLFTLLVTASRFHFVPRTEESKFFIYFVSYLFVTFISAAMMLYVQSMKRKSLDLVSSLAKALDFRDTYTYDHSESVAKYSVQIAEKLNLSKEICHHIQIGGLLHDIGKIGIPENILTKPGKLTDPEYHIIKTHPQIGYDILKHVDFFKNNGILDIVLYHHERFDGNGYPKGLKGSDIPLEARIVAVADTFHAMTSRRVYRNEVELTYALDLILQNKGTQFDPEVVDAFLSCFESTSESSNTTQTLTNNSK